jgi:hypothetical protein
VCIAPQVTVIRKAANSGVRKRSVMKRNILWANRSPLRLIGGCDETVVCDCADDVTAANPNYTVCSVRDDVCNRGDGSGRKIESRCIQHKFDFLADFEARRVHATRLHRWADWRPSLFLFGTWLVDRDGLPISTRCRKGSSLWLSPSQTRSRLNLLFRRHQMQPRGPLGTQLTPSNCPRTPRFNF